MRGLGTNLLDWQKRYGTEEACAKAADAATQAGMGSVALATGMIMAMSSAHAIQHRCPPHFT